MRCFVRDKHNSPSSSLSACPCGFSIDRAQNFVKEMASVPNLKIDYVIINAGVLRYPNVGTATSISEKQRTMLTVVAGYRGVRYLLQHLTIR